MFHSADNCPICSGAGCNNRQEFRTGREPKGPGPTLLCDAINVPSRPAVPAQPPPPQLASLHTPPRCSLSLSEGGPVAPRSRPPPHLRLIWPPGLFSSPAEERANEAVLCPGGDADLLPNADRIATHSGFSPSAVSWWTYLGTPPRQLTSPSLVGGAERHWERERETAAAPTRGCSCWESLSLPPSPPLIVGPGLDGVGSKDTPSYLVAADENEVCRWPKIFFATGKPLAGRRHVVQSLCVWYKQLVHFFRVQVRFVHCALHIVWLCASAILHCVSFHIRAGAVDDLWSPCAHCLVFFCAEYHLLLYALLQAVCIFIPYGRETFLQKLKIITLFLLVVVLTTEKINIFFKNFN